MNGSIEDIENIVLGINDNRVTYIRFKRIGLIAALNEGIKLCQTKYLAIIDSDDIAPTNPIKNQYFYLEKNPEIGLVGTSIKYFVKNLNESIWSIRMPEDHNKIMIGLKKSKFLLHHSR